MLGITAVVGAGSLVVDAETLMSPLPVVGCNIKGNVSVETGERIYHLPHQKYYDETNIRSEYGERWFCTEKAARAAGWRRSKV